MERRQRLFLSAIVVALLVPSPSLVGAASRAVRKDEDLEYLHRVAAWRTALFRNARRVNRLVVMKLHGGPASDGLAEVLRRRVEET